MIYLKKYKIFENDSPEDDEYEEVDDFLFTLSKDDVEDIFLKITDLGFKMQLSKFYCDQDMNEIARFNFGNSWEGLKNSVYRGSCDFLTEFVKGNVYGCYKVTLNLKINNWTLLSRADLDIYTRLFTELKQISGNFYTKWELVVGSDNMFKINFLMLCNPQRDRQLIKKFIFSVRDSEQNSIVYDHLESIISLIKSEITPLMRNNLLNYPNTIGDKLYFLFKSCSKQLVTVNMKKIQVLNYRGLIVNKNIIEDSEEIRKKLGISEVYDKYKLTILELQIDLNQMNKLATSTYDYKFLDSLYKRI